MKTTKKRYVDSLYLNEPTFLIYFTGQSHTKSEYSLNSAWIMRRFHMVDADLVQNRIATAISTSRRKIRQHNFEIDLSPLRAFLRLTLDRVQWSHCVNQYC